MLPRNQVWDNPAKPSRKYLIDTYNNFNPDNIDKKRKSTHKRCFVVAETIPLQYYEKSIA